MGVTAALAVGEPRPRRLHAHDGEHGDADDDDQGLEAASDHCGPRLPSSTRCDGQPQVPW